MIIACDPGLSATAIVLLDEDQDVLFHQDTWRFGPEHGDDASRIAEYCTCLRSTLMVTWDPPIGLFAIEDQKTALVAVGAAQGPSGGRVLPEAIRAAIGASGAGNDARRGAVAARGSKNSALIRLAKLAGALEQVAVEFGLRVIRVSPQDAKRALTGDPKASKRTMKLWARMAYPTRNEHEDDCIGIYFAGRAVLRLEAMK